MATAEVCGGVWGGEERSEPSCVPPRHGQARGPERCACAGPRGETLSCPGPGRLPGVRASMRAIKGGREGRAASRHKRPPHARPSASCPPHATPTGRRAPAPTSNQLRSLSRRPPQRAKPRPLATRAAMKKPRSEKPCPQSVPLTYRTGSLAAETPERSVVCDGAVCLPTQTHTQHTYTRTQLVSVCFLIQPKTTSLGVAPPIGGWTPFTSITRKMSYRLTCLRAGPCDGDHSSVEVPSSHMTLCEVYKANLQTK